MMNIRDIYDYCYCNRSIYFKYIMPVEKDATPKMKIGNEFHKSAEELINKQKIKKYIKNVIRSTGNLHKFP